MLMPMTYGLKNRVLLLQPDDGVRADLGHLHLSGSMIRPGDETGSAAQQRHVWSHLEFILLAGNPWTVGWALAADH